MAQNRSNVFWGLPLPPHVACHCQLVIQQPPWPVPLLMWLATLALLTIVINVISEKQLVSNQMKQKTIIPMAQNVPNNMFGAIYPIPSTTFTCAHHHCCQCSQVWSGLVFHLQNGQPATATGATSHLILTDCNQTK